MGPGAPRRREVLRRHPPGRDRHDLVATCLPLPAHGPPTPRRSPEPPSRATWPTWSRMARRPAPRLGYLTSLRGFLGISGRRAPSGDLGRHAYTERQCRQGHRLEPTAQRVRDPCETGGWEDLPVNRQQGHEEHSQPEVRYGDRRARGHLRRPLSRSPRPKSRHQTQRGADDDRYYRSRHHQAQRHPQPARDLMSHRHPGHQRASEIEMGSAGQPVPVLHQQRVIQMKLRSYPGDCLRRRIRSPARVTAGSPGTSASSMKTANDTIGRAEAGQTPIGLSLPRCGRRQERCEERKTVSRHATAFPASTAFRALAQGYAHRLG